MKVKVVKNKVAPPFAEAEFDIIYNHGINKEGSVIDVGLQQGVVENRQILTIASMRADAEEQYGLRMGEIGPSVDRMSSAGFGKDDGASVRKVRT